LRESTLKRFDLCIVKKQLLNIFGVG